MTDAQALLVAVSQRGVRLTVDSGDIVHRGPRGALDAELIPRLKACKAAIVAELRRQARAHLDPADVFERAAFLEFCEGLPRVEADARALGEAGFATWEALALAIAEQFNP